MREYYVGYASLGCPVIIWRWGLGIFLVPGRCPSFKGLYRPTRKQKEPIHTIN